MRKPVPEYYKLMEDKLAKYITRDEIVKFIEKEKKGNSTSLKFPQAPVYYRRTAIDNVIITSLSWLSHILFCVTFVTFIYMSVMPVEPVVVYAFTKIPFDFFITACITGLIYKMVLGNKFFVVIDNDEEMVQNLKSKSIVELFRIFRMYPECRDLYMSIIEKKEE